MSHALTSETTKLQQLRCLHSGPTHGDDDLHARGTVNAENLAVDPLAVLRGEEADDAGNVDGETDTVER